MDPEGALKELTAAAGDDLGRLLMRASREVSQATVARLHEQGFTDVRPSHAAVLAHLDAAGTRMADLAHRSGMSRQAVAVAVRELGAAGYVETRPDPDDGRATDVRLAPRGVELCLAVARTLRDETQQWGAATGDDGLAVLLAGLRRLIDATRSDAEQHRP